MATSALTREAMAEKKARGERVGDIPHGYRLADDGRTLEADANEREIIATVRRLRGEGLTLRAICERLTALGELLRRRAYDPTLAARDAAYLRRHLTGARRGAVKEVQTTIRVDADLMERIDRLKAKMAADPEARAHGRVSRSVVLRVAILHGVEVLEHRYGTDGRKGRGR